eukprot:gene10019-10174_t
MSSMQSVFYDALEPLQELGFGQRLQTTFLCAVASALYLKFFVRQYAPSIAAVLLVLPVLALNMVLPLMNPLDEILPRSMWLLLLSWLGSFKALGMCCNRGPLAGSWTTAQFIVLYILPIYPREETATKGRLGDHVGSSSKVAMTFTANTTLLVVVSYCLAVHQMPDLLRYYMYFLGLYAFISFVMEGTAAALMGLLSLEVVPPMDQPWKSTSIADFWSRRWNNVVGLTLRALVYDPIVEGRVVRKAPTAASQGSSCSHPAPIPLSLKLAGMTATFVVSGLAHEWILYCIAYKYNPYYWFVFFTVQAPVCVLEGVCRKWLKSKGVNIPDVVGAFYSTVALLFMASLFWFPPLETYDDSAQRVVAAVNSNVAALQGLAAGLWGFDSTTLVASIDMAAVSA